MKIRKEPIYFVSKNYQGKELELYTQPWYRYWIAKIYSIWVFNIFKFLAPIDRWRDKRSNDILSIDAKRDCKYWDLSHKKRKLIRRLVVEKSSRETNDLH